MTDFDKLTRDYHLRQQYQPGWFDLLSLMIDSMFSNASEDDGLAFLRQTGERLAQLFPVGEVETLADLENSINQQLALFHWGTVDIEAADAILVITHLALPPGNQVMDDARWQRVMAAILQGMYAGWLQALGGQLRLVITPVAGNERNRLRLHYQR
ncbi:hypothetical protein BTJ39_23505 [Izhakiella australiensis]|uniref:Cellulose synthase n=1 Tax=Izhakiella australiensis TaxID=1926881 RepID=A0A1S8Y6L7_9GAMM|nr:cellulose biosynthesis protein BcsD [Izhakiella australiensis]OON34690.1 hypothetical protein BTJ39_23505 [Izhakiella australiensis]